MKDSQGLGGVAAFVSAGSYIFAIALFMTLMKPISSADTPIGEYVSFLAAHRQLAFLWNFTMYLLHGASLVILVLALDERIREASPRIASISSAFGMIWAAFVLASGFINIWANESILALFSKDPALAETVKNSVSVLATGIDSSDKYLGGLWIALTCLGSFRGKAFPKIHLVFGTLLGAGTMLLGIILPPNDSTASLVFGLGAILWWSVVGASMLRKRKA